MVPGTLELMLLYGVGKQMENELAVMSRQIKIGIKNPPATEISSRGTGVLQVDLQVDITPSAWLYHAVVCFLECLRIL